MGNRAVIFPIHFPLPNEAQRQQLLNHWFRGKQIKQSHIDTLAQISVGYSHRELLAFVESIKENTLTLETLETYFNRYADTLRRAFKAEFKCAEIFMPSFGQCSDIQTLFASNPALSAQLYRLQHEVSVYPQKHTLLWGPPGGGKTTAVRVFAQTSGRVLISVTADQRTLQTTLEKLFSKAKQLGEGYSFL